MPRYRLLLSGTALLFFVVPLHSQTASTWKDPSPHTIQFVSVGDNVRLEVLDWGGRVDQLCFWQVVETRRMSLTILRQSLQPTITSMELRGAASALPVMPRRVMSLSDWAKMSWP